MYFTNKYLKQFFLFFSLFVFTLSFISPYLISVSSNIVYAKDEVEPEVEVEPAPENKGSVKSITKLPKEDIDLLKENIKFDEDVYKKLIYEFLFNVDGKTMIAEEYVKVFSDSEYEMKVGNKVVANNILRKMADEDFDTVPDSKILLRTPLFDGNSGSFDKFLKGDDGGMGAFKLSTLTSREPGETKLTKSKAYDLQSGGIYTHRRGYIGTTEEFKQVNRPQFISTLYNPASGGKFKKHTELDKYIEDDAGRTKNDSQIGSFLYVNPDIYNEEALLFDNYGNIVTESGQIVIPTWMNNLFGDVNNTTVDNKSGKHFLSSPYLANKEFVSKASTYYFGKEDNYSYFYEIAAGLNKDCNSNLGVDKNDDSAKKACKDGNGTPNSLQLKFGKDLYATYGSKTKDRAYAEGKSSSSLESTVSGYYGKESTLEESEKAALVDYIFNKSLDHAKRLNGLFMDIYNSPHAENAEIYYDLSSTTRSGDSIDDIDDALEYIKLAENLLQKINRIFEVGLFELLRLTVAALVSDVYNSTFINFPVSEVFFTNLISDSALWKSLMKMVLLIVVSFTTFYVVYLAFRVFIGTSNIKEVLMRVLLLALSVAAPTLLYSPLVNLIFNKPAELILNTEMDRMMILDTWLYEFETSFRETIESAELSYKDYEDLIRDRSEDYTIEFVTNTTVEGERISTKPTSSEEIQKDYKNVYKKDLITVDVSIFHIHDWLNNAVVVDNAVVKGHPSLFEYLDTNYSDIYYGIEFYDEFTYNVWDDANELFNNSDRDLATGKNVSASSLLADIYKNYVGATDEESKGYLTTLARISKHLFYDGYEETEIDEAGVPYTARYDFDADTINLVLGDISLTSDYRNEISGSTEVSDFTKKVFEAYDIVLPSSDLLRLETILEPMKGYRFGKEIELAQEVSSVNISMIDRYANLYLPVRLMVFKSDDMESINDTYALTEQFVLSLETFFAVSREYEITNFASGISVHNITLDTFIRMMFIPINEFTPENSDINDVSEYIAKKNSLIDVLLFLIFILVLWAYGIVKWIILSVVLMPALFVLFLYNYVIKNNPNNKAWLGAMTIMGSFAFSNLGLLLIWKGLVYNMNSKELNIILRQINLTVDGGSGRMPYVLLNTFIITAYLILVFKFLLLPLFKNVKDDWVNLGGEKFNQKFGDLSAGFSNMVNGMWNSSDYSKSGKDGGLLGGLSVNPNDKKYSDGIKTTDTGKAGEMTPNRLSGSENMSPEDKKKLDLINSKVEGDSGINSGVGVQDTRNKSLIGKAKDKITSLPGGIKSTASGFRRRLGNSVYDGLMSSADGSKSPGKIKTFAATQLRNAIIGEFGAITDGGSAAKQAAGILSSGVAATLAGGVLGGTLGKLKAKTLSPFTLAQAALLASQLASLRKGGNKIYDNVKDLSPEQLALLKSNGMDKDMRELDVTESRGDNLVTLDMLDETASLSIAKFLKGKQNVLVDGNQLVLNYSDEEFSDEKVANQFFEDLSYAIGTSNEEMAVMSLIFQERLNTPISRFNKLDSNGEAEFDILGDKSGYLKPLLTAYKKGIENGIIDSSDYDKAMSVGMSEEDFISDMKKIQFVTREEGEKFFSKLSEDTEAIGQLLNGDNDNKSLIHTSEATDYLDLIKLLDLHNMSYTSDNENRTVTLDNLNNESEIWDTVLGENENLANKLSELTLGNLFVEEDSIVYGTVKQWVNEGKFIADEDFVLDGNGNVTALTTKAKAALVDFKDSYDSLKADNMASMQTMYSQLSETLNKSEVIDGNYVFDNGPNSLQFGSVDRTVNSALNNTISNSSVGKMAYRMNNDIDFSSYMDQLNELRLVQQDVKRGKYNNVQDLIDNSLHERPLLDEEIELLNLSARMSLEGVSFERLNDSTVNVYSNSTEATNLVPQFLELMEARNTLRAQHREEVQINLTAKHESESR